MVLLPTLIAFSKRFSSVPCPWDLARYGGDAVYRHNLSYPVGPAEIGHCFPAGHASGGFALLALYFAAYASARFPAVYLLPGILVGVVFALAQQARGAHFISHDLWTLSICWFGALGLYVLFRPQTWPRQGDTP
jgi:membrane-associated PAP2 superfamily phosphatase